MARGKYLSDCERGLIIGAWCGAGASVTGQLAAFHLEQCVMSAFRAGQKGMSKYSLWKSRFNDVMMLVHVCSVV